MDIDSLSVRGIPYDNWDTGVSDTVVFHLDNNAVPVVTVERISTEQSGDIEISFSLFDAEDDDIDYMYFYSEDAGTTWAEADIEPVLQDSIVVWHSADNLPLTDQTDIQVKVVPSDNDLGVADSTGSFHVDNWHIHSVTLDSIFGEQTGEVEFTYSAYDSTGDTLTLLFSYSADAGETWEIFDTVSGVDTLNYEGNYTWDSEAQLGGQDIPDLLVQVVTSDSWQESGSDTVSFHLDNNVVPTVQITDITGEQHEDVPVEFTLEDAEDDTLTYAFWYSADNGATWDSASVSEGSSLDGRVVPPQLGGREKGGSTGSSLGVTTLTIRTFGSREVLDIIWHSGVNLPDVDLEQVRFKITVADNDTGIPDSTETFTVDNYQFHSVELNDITTEQTDNVEIEYTLTDATGDELGILVEYSQDNGSSWNACTIAGDTSGIGSDDYTGAVTWLSVEDLPGEDDTLLVRMTAYDNWEFGASDTISFHLDNNAVPEVLITDITGERSGVISIEYEAFDPEDDELSLGYFYSPDDGATWEEATIDDNGGILSKSGKHGKILKTREKSDTVTPKLISSSVNGRRHSTSFIWLSDVDLPDEDNDLIHFKITVEDNDPGIPDSIGAFTVDNYHDQTVTLDEIEGEQSGLVQLNYQLTDVTNDTLSVEFYYSEDSGATWDPAGSVSDIGGGEYQGEYTWDTESQLPGVDIFNFQLRAISLDEWQSGGADTVQFHLDNNAVPTVIVVDIDEEQSGDVEITFSPDDAEDDDLTYEFYYSEYVGMDWQSATIDTVIPDSMVIWHSVNDIPASDQSDIQFMIRPFDNDMGESDSSDFFQVDNWHAQIIDIQPIEGDEQTADVTITFEINDAENDDISLVTSYSADNGTSWLSPSISGQTEGYGPGNYQGELTWHSGQDLPNIDNYSVMFKIMPHDNWQAGYADTSLFHLDNETGPQLIYAQESIYPLPQNSIEVRFDRPMDPSSIDGNIDVTSINVGSIGTAEFVYSNQGNSVQIFLPDGIPSTDALQVTLYNGLQDTLGKGFDGNQDGDPQYSIEDDTTLFVYSYMIGDFDNDDLMGQSDIDLFSSGWSSNDPEIETGPAQGDMPHLILQPDGLFDIEDLMTFVMFWNYSASQGLLYTSVDGTLNDNRLITDWDGYNLRLGLLSVGDISGAHFMINHDSTLVRELGSASVVTPDGDPGQVMHFSHRDQEGSANHEFLGFLQPTGADKDTTWLISLPIELGVRSVVKLPVTYEYQVSNTRFTGVRVVRLEPIPEQFALHQNYPNPFNPTTTIEYDLPKDAYVYLVIYDILGRKIRTLVSGAQPAGYAEVRWNGTDDWGNKVGTGIYFYRIETGKFSKTYKMVFLK
jgi:hypothetical protein